MKVIPSHINMISFFFGCILLGIFIFFNADLCVQSCFSSVKAQQLDDDNVSMNTNNSKQFNVTFNGISEY